jgi:hypothetical protein
MHVETAKRRTSRGGSGFVIAQGCFNPPTTPPTGLVTVVTVLFAVFVAVVTVLFTAVVTVLTIGGAEGVVVGVVVVVVVVVVVGAGAELEVDGVAVEGVVAPDEGAGAVPVFEVAPGVLGLRSVRSGFTPGRRPSECEVGAPISRGTALARCRPSRAGMTVAWAASP